MTCRCGCSRPATVRGLSKACYQRCRYWGWPPEIPAPTRKGNDGRRQDRLEDYTELRSWGESIAAAADRVGISPQTAERWYEPDYRRQRVTAAA